jgi:hypothetical protein
LAFRAFQPQVGLRLNLRRTVWDRCKVQSKQWTRLLILLVKVIVMVNLLILALRFRGVMTGLSLTKTFGQDSLDVFQLSPSGMLDERVLFFFRELAGEDIQGRLRMAGEMDIVDGLVYRLLELTSVDVFLARVGLPARVPIRTEAELDIQATHVLLVIFVKPLLGRAPFQWSFVLG